MLDKLKDIFRKKFRNIMNKILRKDIFVRTNNNKNKSIPSIIFSKEVLDNFRENVGKYMPETGGMIASTNNENIIDKCYFDVNSKNTSGSFYYDVESMSVIYRQWKDKGYTINGIYHSHPEGAIRPSYHDVSSALLHLDFFKLNYFYMPIIQSQNNGEYKMYFYVVRRNNKSLDVKLEYILNAVKSEYKYDFSMIWSMNYEVENLRKYLNNVHDKKHKIEKKKASIVASKKVKTKLSDNSYFIKVKDLYPEKVLEKVIVCIGTGGARSFLENMARCGFKNYVLIDADVVSPSNIATQAVYISEIGKKKVDVIRNSILDINPNAKVVCVDRFLDENMSDIEFKSYLDCFKGKKSKDYLILGCTDNFEAQKRSSLLALKYGIPYMAAMMYEGGGAAEVIFVYPGVTESCPRCLLRDRFEKYENGFKNNVDSSSCPIFATERMNSLKGYIALMMLMYNEDDSKPYSKMLDEIKNRNFVEIRMDPYLSESKLKIGLFDRVFDGALAYTFMDETLWIPQHPDRPEFGEKTCKLCGGTGDLNKLQSKWKYIETLDIDFGEKKEESDYKEKQLYKNVKKQELASAKTIALYDRKYIVGNNYDKKF